MKNIVLLIVAFFTFLTCPAQVGALDPAFGVNGNAMHICTTDYFDFNSIRLSDNSYLLFGNQLSHYTADGNLDLTYGVNGYKPIMIPNFGGFPKLQADGKIILAGNSNSPVTTCALGRIDINGSPDPSFGTNGKATYTGLDSFQFMDISPDQTIVSSAVTSGNQLFKVYKVLPNGSLDTSFGTNGIVDTKVYPSGTDNYVLGGLNVQQDGKIVVSGYVTHYDVGSSIATYGMFVVRYLANGSLDPTFGTNGISIYSDYLFGSIVQIIQPDGKIVIAGSSYTVNPLVFSIDSMRFLPNGALDTTFGNNGFTADALTNTNSLEINNILLQPDGKIVLVGGSTNTDQFLIARYTTAGVLDPNFNNTGFNLLQINNLSFSHYLNVYLQPDLKLVAIGNGYNSSTNLYSTVFSRFNSGLLEAEGFSKSEVGVYPNPSEGMVYLDNSNSSFKTVQVYNSIGQLVSTQTLGVGSSVSIDLSSYSKGVYLLNFQGEKGGKSCKVVKE